MDTDLAYMGNRPCCFIDNHAAVASNGVLPSGLYHMSYDLSRIYIPLRSIVRTTGASNIESYITHPLRQSNLAH